MGHQGGQKNLVLLFDMLNHYPNTLLDKARLRMIRACLIAKDEANVVAGYPIALESTLSVLKRANVSIQAALFPYLKQCAAKLKLIYLTPVVKKEKQKMLIDEEISMAAMSVFPRVQTHPALLALLDAPLFLDESNLFITIHKEKKGSLSFSSTG